MESWLWHTYNVRSDKRTPSGPGGKYSETRPPTLIEVFGDEAVYNTLISSLGASTAEGALRIVDARNEKYQLIIAKHHITQLKARMDSEIEQGLIIEKPCVYLFGDCDLSSTKNVLARGNNVVLSSYPNGWIVTFSLKDNEVMISLVCPEEYRGNPKTLDISDSHRIDITSGVGSIPVDVFFNDPQRINPELYATIFFND